MKKALVATLALISLSALAIDGQLDGRTFCRKVKTGMFGQPTTVRNHCVSFQGGRAHDNANTFFGNPPESFTYDVIKNRIINVDTNKVTSYDLRGKTLVIRETGAVLTLVK